MFTYLIYYYYFFTLNDSDKGISSVSALVSSKVKPPGCYLLQRRNEDGLCHSWLVCVILLTDLLTVNPATQIISMVIICAYKKFGILELACGS